ncbi:FitA-like ribbon-helix-helix domain-containing protein [Haloactinomyces albus]|uniref:Plasmid stability protein n=1 Tax=Haloactinomyces albus TaxID=1352928 RepID=A0AAE3ZAN2_9ACTN|nr:plasmid stabilization protein [Haloactinomyces albus]MDR7301401.1 plasmid stability protein [Haloactinomyces albus]
MATLTVRGLDDELHARLRVHAAQRGRSMEAEVRAILQDRLSSSPLPASGLGSRMHARFAAIEDAELEPPSRSEVPR